MAYSVPSIHPYLWLTPQRVADLKNEATSGAGLTRYNTLKTYVDTHMQEFFPPAVEAFALLWQLTGNTVYADRAIAITSGMLTTGDISPDSGYQARNNLPGPAIVYDWCYDRIVALGLQNTYVSGLVTIGDWVWPETNPSRTGAWAVDDPSSNYYHGFLFTWLLGLSFYHDHPSASGYVNQALRRWNTEVIPYLSGQGAGGYLLEGTAYGLAGTTKFIFWNLAAHYTATGDNLATSGSFTWPKDAALQSIYLTCPNRAQIYPGGDQGRDATAGVYDYQRGVMLASQSVLDSTTAGYARWWTDNVIPNTELSALQYWEDFLWYYPYLTSINYTSGSVLTPGVKAAGVGLGNSRSGWDTSATQVFFMCGPNYSPGDHNDKAANGYQIFRDGWLAAAAKINSHSGLHSKSSDNNSITIGGFEQTNLSDASTLKRSAETSGYAYYLGDAGTTYLQGNGSNHCNSFLRHFLYLKPNFIVVCDRVDAPSSSEVKKWHLNTLNLPTVSGQTFTASGVLGAKLFGTIHAPNGSTVSITNVNYGGGNEDQLSSYRVDTAAATGNQVDYFLQTLETAPSGQAAASAVSALTTNQTGVLGVQIGSQVAVFETRQGPASSFTFNIAGSNGSKSFTVATDRPGTVYNWSLTPTSGTTATTGAVTADSQGLLTWTTSTSGPIAVAMTTASAAPPFSVYQPAGTLVSSAAAGSTVTLSGDSFTTSSGTVTVGTSGMTLSSWTNGALVGTLPTQVSYPHTDDITVSWNTGSALASGAHFTAANTQFLKATNPPKLQISDQSWSWCCWAKLDSKSFERALFGKFDQTGNQRGWLMVYDGGADRFRFYQSTTGVNIPNIVDSRLGSPATGVWYFLAGSYNFATTTLSLSINNGLLDTNATIDHCFNNTADFYISTHTEGTTSPWDGSVDNLGIWVGKTFTAAEITALYNAGLGVDYAALAGTSLSGATCFWQLDDAGGSAGIWLDKAGNVPLTGATSTAAPTAVSGKVTSLTSHTDTYSSFVTTAAASSGSLSITSINQPSGLVVSTAVALSTVDIFGTLFGATSGSVFFGTNPATVTSWSTGHIVCIVPLQSSYPLTVAVQVKGSNGQSALQSGFTVTSPPATITNIQQPLSTVVTSALNGSTVDIVGTYFGPTSGSVTVNGVAAGVSAWSDTDLTIVLPAQASYPNVGTVLVTTSDSRTASQSNFTTTTSSPAPSPSSDSSGGGASAVFNLFFRHRLK